MVKLSELDNRIERKRRGGGARIYELHAVPDKELAKRMALWHRRELLSYRRYEERHKSLIYRWLIVECTDGSTLRLSAGDMSPYFRNQTSWAADGVYYYADISAPNWWILAPWFSISSISEEGRKNKKYLLDKLEQDLI